MSDQKSGERIVILGRIGGAFGVAGWVKIQSFTDPPANLLKYPVWLLRSAASVGSRPAEWKEYRWLQGREVAQAVQAQLEGVTTRDQAGELRGTEIGVRRSDMPALKPGEYYWEDLIGLDALTPEGAALGRVVEIRAMPAHPLLRIVAQGSKAQEILVPLVRERIKAVDLPNGRVTVDWQRDWSSGE